MNKIIIVYVSQVQKHKSIRQVRSKPPNHIHQNPRPTAYPKAHYGLTELHTVSWTSIKIGRENFRIRLHYGLGGHNASDKEIGIWLKFYCFQ